MKQISDLARDLVIALDNLAYLGENRRIAEKKVHYAATQQDPSGQQQFVIHKAEQGEAERALIERCRQIVRIADLIEVLK